MMTELITKMMALVMMMTLIMVISDGDEKDQDDNE